MYIKINVCKQQCDVNCFRLSSFINQTINEFVSGTSQNAEIQSHVLFLHSADWSTRKTLRRRLQLRFDSHSTATRPRYDHSTTYVTTGLLLHCSLNNNRSAQTIYKSQFIFFAWELWFWCKKSVFKRFWFLISSNNRKLETWYWRRASIQDGQASTSA